MGRPILYSTGSIGKQGAHNFPFEGFGRNCTRVIISIILVLTLFKKHRRGDMSEAGYNLLASLLEAKLVITSKFLVQYQEAMAPYLHKQKDINSFNAIHKMCDTTKLLIWGRLGERDRQNPSSTLAFTSPE